MIRRKYVITIVLLAIALFAILRWLFGMAIPEAWLSFSIGATLTFLGGLISGRAFTLASIRLGWVINLKAITFLLITFIVIAFVAVAFMLNAMIAKTTLLPFAVTVLLIFLINGALGALITLVREQYKSGISTAKAAMEQSRNELQLLQAQLSPHFLFNTLNNLYGLSLSEPDRVPPLLLKLSELLRYSVYDVKQVFVPMQQEVDYILNYIEFERLRLGLKLQLSTEIEKGFDSECQIPPLLLIVFVENAFKHSRTTTDQPIWINIKLRRDGKRIVFFIENSRPPEHVEKPRLEKHSGFGLDSVKRRLSLLYSDKHSLTIKESSTKYIVDLQLECL